MKFVVRFVFLVLALVGWGQAQNPLAPLLEPDTPLPVADPFVGSFSDEYNVLTLDGGNGQYSGELDIEGQVFPVTAQGDSSQLVGEFTIDTDTYIFTLQLTEDGVILAVNGEELQMSRIAEIQPVTPQPVTPQPVSPQPVPTPQPVDPLPVNPTPEPEPFNLNDLPMPEPFPTPLPMSSSLTPQPPQGPWEGNYNVSLYSQTNPEQKQQTLANVKVTPQSDGTYHFLFMGNGQVGLDTVVDATGRDMKTGENQFPLTWNTGQTSLNGFPMQVSTENGTVTLSLQEGQDHFLAQYDEGGTLLYLLSCTSGECMEIEASR